MGLKSASIPCTVIVPGFGDGNGVGSGDTGNGDEEISPVSTGVTSGAVDDGEISDWQATRATTMRIARTST